MSRNVWIKANLRDKKIQDKNLAVTQADGSSAGLLLFRCERFSHGDPQFPVPVGQ